MINTRIRDGVFCSHIESSLTGTDFLVYHLTTQVCTSAAIIGYV